MTGSERGSRTCTLIREYRESSHPAVVFLRDILWVVCIVGAIALLLFAVSGTWPAVVAVESESMVPNMNVGDLVFVAAVDRYGGLHTWEESRDDGFSTFGDYGDVIIYRPNGVDGVHPIIHRVRSWAQEGDYVDRSTGEIITTSAGYEAPHEGYITKGDNAETNQIIDQAGYYWGDSRIGAIEPVRQEWVVGKALFAIPLVGFIPLNIIPFAVVVIVVMVLWELVCQARKGCEEEAPVKSKKKRR